MKAPQKAKPALLRATVSDALTGTGGSDCKVLVDGADSNVTAGGLTGYIPTVGDRLLVQRVGHRVEVIQFISSAVVPYAPDMSGITGDIVDINATMASLQASLGVAQTDINAVQTTADGKNTVHYSVSGPGTTPNNVNDIWFQTDFSNHIIAQYRGVGSGQWVPQTLSHQTISSIDAGTITVGTLTGVNISGVNLTGVNITGSTITGGTFQTAVSGGRISIWQYGNYGQIAFYPDSSGWDPGLIFGNYNAGATAGQLSLKGPVPTGSGVNPAGLDLVTSSAGVRSMQWTSNDIHWWTSSSGNWANIYLHNTNTFQVKGAWGNINFIFDDSGFNPVISATNATNPTGLWLRGNQVRFNLPGERDAVVRTPSDGVAVQIGRSDTFTSLTFIDGELRVTTWASNGYQPIKASAFNVTSDASTKEDPVPVVGATELLRKVPVYDYQTAQGSPNRASDLDPVRDKPEKWKDIRFTQRGVMAQDLEAVAPHLVTVDDSEVIDGQHDQMAVDIYGLLATGLAAIKEIDARLTKMEGAKK